MRVFRVNNVIRGGAGCSCHTERDPELDPDHDEDNALPQTMNDLLVKQGRMKSETRDRLRADRRRAEERVERAMKGHAISSYQGRVIGRASQAEAELASPPSTLDAIKARR